MNHFSHLNKQGKINMVDISNKKVSLRKAEAIAEVLMKSETVDKISNNNIMKGNVLTTAQVAGISAAKTTYLAIPLCHNIKLNKVDIWFKFHKTKIIIYSKVIAKDTTGAEMEALNAVSTAALTIYDMVKAVDKTVLITNITLKNKRGGKSIVLSGKILSINVSDKKGVQKNPVKKAKFIADFGIENDAHAGSGGEKQVSLLAFSSYKKMLKKNVELNYGAFGENLTVQGVKLYNLPLGTTIEFQSGLKMIVTRIGKECHSRCKIYEIAGDCVMPREGIFCNVIKGGIICRNDIFKVIIN